MNMGKWAGKLLPLAVYELRKESTMKKIFSRESILPDRTNHCDESGHKAGHSYQGLLGYDNHYDNHGHKVGYSYDSLLGKKTRIKK